MIIQLLIVLLALYVGSRYGSLALGAISGIGLAILVLGFGMKPGNPPTDVIYIIIAAVTCAGIMQAAGGMDWLIQLAERLLRKHPAHVTFLAPLCTFFLTVLVGTGHVVYTLMPIICDIALKKGIRPERPCGVASVASQVGITCSPIAAAVASFVIISNDAGFEVNNLQVIAVTIPAMVIQGKMVRSNTDEPHMAVKSSVEGEVCLLRIHAIIVLVADGDLQQVLVPQLSGQFRPECGISALVVAKFFTIQKHFTGVGSAVQLQEHSISSGFLHGQLPRIPAGAAVIIIASILAVDGIPGVWQGNGFQGGVPAFAEAPALL